MVGSSLCQGVLAASSSILLILILAGVFLLTMLLIEVSGMLGLVCGWGWGLVGMCWGGGLVLDGIISVSLGRLLDSGGVLGICWGWYWCWGWGMVCFLPHCLASSLIRSSLGLVPWLGCLIRFFTLKFTTGNSTCLTTATFIVVGCIFGCAL